MAAVSAMHHDRDELTDVHRRCLRETSKQHTHLFSGAVTQVLTTLRYQNARMVSHTMQFSFTGAIAEWRRFALLSSLLNWLGETPAQRSNNATPGYLSFGMAGMCKYPETP